jgi:hypothetical protein
MAGARTLTATTTGTRRRMMKMKEMPEMPYSLQLAIMSMGGNDRGVIQVFSKCINDMTKKLLDVAESYDYEDLPFVVASMQLTARSLSTLLDDRGKSLAEKVVAHVHSVTIDLTELKKQMEEDTNEKVDD